ncbi:unnamed protein product, partial [Polarella glacialis]
VGIFPATVTFPQAVVHHQPQQALVHHQLQQVQQVQQVPCPKLGPLSQTHMAEQAMHIPRSLPFGHTHRFHAKAAAMGMLSKDYRSFTKKQHKGGRLSIISESRVHFGGVMRYAVQFTDGELSNADGVGFIFSADCPCPRDIQKIVSVFVSRTGRICVRAHAQVERCAIRVKELELGDWLEVVTDLEQQTIDFTVWPVDGGRATTAKVGFGHMLSALRRQVPSVPQAVCGYLAVVMKNIGMSVTLGS